VAPLDSHRALAIFRGRLFGFLTILSLLLCLATVGLWVRSYWRLDGLVHISIHGTSGEFRIESIHGELKTTVWHWPRPGSVPGWRYYTVSHPRNYAAESLNWPAVSFPGFRYQTFSGRGISYRGIFFPHWFLALLFAILPMMRLRAILRTRRRHRAGLCEHCGYDLRATPDRCPECGHVS
jgi:hypothetical protein